MYNRFKVKFKGEKMSLFGKYKYGKQYKLLIIAVFIYYNCIMGLKLTYSTQLVDIMDAFNETKANVGLGLTYYYFSYGAAQVVLSLFISKIDLKKFFLIMTILSAGTFSIIGFVTKLWHVTLILTINGVFQCATWGGLIHICTKSLPEDLVSFSIKLLITGYASSNALAYGVSAIFSVISWKLSFVFWGALCIISLLYMLAKEKQVERLVKAGDENVYDLTKLKEDKTAKAYMIPKEVKFNIVPLVILTCLSALFVQTTTYSFSNWVPNLLVEEHGFPNYLSILISLVLPLATLPVTLLMFKYLDKTNKVLDSSIFINFISVALFALMAFIFNSNPIVAITMSIILKIMTALLTVQTSTYVLAKFNYHVNTAAVALIVNSLTSAGAGLAPFISGLIMDASGWQAYYLFMAGLILVNLIALIVVNVKVKKEKKVDAYI